MGIGAYLEGYVLDCGIVVYDCGGGVCNPSDSCVECSDIEFIEVF